MQIRANWGILAVLALSITVGCSQTRQTVRGQSPAAVTDGNQGPIIGTAPGYGQLEHGYKAQYGHHDFRALQGFRDNNFGYEGGFYAGPEGYYSEHDRTYAVAGQGGCPECNYGQSCPNEGCHRCGNRIAAALGHGPNGFPTHYQTYSYNWPQNQVYPDNQVPAGMVQYPYYTLRGPTDFFMK